MSIHRLLPRARRAVPRPRIGFAAILLGVLLAGCGGGEGEEGKAEYDPPQISYARFEPSSLSDNGGTARIIAHVSDASGVAWVRATFTRPDGSQSALDLTWNQAGYYEVSVQVPANFTSDDQRYSATITAADRNGSMSQAVSVGTLTVRTDSGPPPPPNL